MSKFLYKRVLPCALALGMTMSGCGEKSECEIPSSHVHKYIKTLTNGITIECFRDDERLDYWGYKWDSEHIEINKIDEEVYKLFMDKGLFEGSVNWDYLYNKMATHHDYLEFYYEYTTTETYTETDSKGKTVVKTKTVHHDGWHKNPHDSNNTGRTRLYHHKYYGYKLVCKDGKFKLEESPLVDDIRDVINEYPYFNENCISLVYQEYKFWRSQLSSLRAEDFNDFIQPDLENKSIEKGKVKVLK